MKKLLFILFFTLSVQAAYIPGALTRNDLATVMAQNYSTRAMPLSTDYYGLTYGGGIYCAVGGGATAAGQVASSTSEGELWVSRTASTLKTWRAVTYGISTFVAVSVSTSSTNQVMTSTDCENWSSSTATGMTVMSDVRWISGLNLFVAVGDYQDSFGGTNYSIATSTNGTVWTQRTAPTGLTAVNFDRLINGGNIILASVTTTPFPAGGKIIRSTNGTTWTQINEGSNASIYPYTGMGWNGSKFMISTRDGYVKTSPDGITWTNQTKVTADGSNTRVDQINWNGYVWVLMGKGLIATSVDGKLWAYINPQMPIVNKLIYTGSRFIGVTGILVSGLNNNVFLTGSFNF